MIEVDFADFGKTIDQLTAVMQGLSEEMVTRRLAAMEPELLEAFRAAVPKETGAAAKSVRVTTKHEDGRWVIEFTTDSKHGYLWLTLTGTEPHVIKARRILRWEEAGETHFARFVRHPGTKPQSWLAKSLKGMQSVIVQGMIES